MKKTYNQPSCFVVVLGSRNAMMITLSANNASMGLDGTSYGGNTGTTVTTADVKGVTDVNLWDNEW